MVTKRLCFVKFMAFASIMGCRGENDNQTNDWNSDHGRIGIELPVKNDSLLGLTLEGDLWLTDDPLDDPAVEQPGAFDMRGKLFLSDEGLFLERGRFALINMVDTTEGKFRGYALGYKKVSYENQPTEKNKDHPIRFHQFLFFGGEFSNTYKFNHGQIDLHAGLDIGGPSVLKHERLQEFNRGKTLLSFGPEAHIKLKYLTKDKNLSIAIGARRMQTLWGDLFGNKGSDSIAHRGGLNFGEYVFIAETLETEIGVLINPDLNINLVIEGKIYRYRTRTYAEDRENIDEDDSGETVTIQIVKDF